MSKSAGSDRVSLEDHVKEIQSRRLINSEYQRGYMEGQQAAAREFAAVVDNILFRFEHVAISRPLKTEIYKITGRKAA